MTGAAASAPTGANLRAREIIDFLSRSGWEAAHRAPLKIDASTRRYERLRLKSMGAILMDAPRVESSPCPPGASEEERVAMGWNAIARLAASRVEAFAAVDGFLTSIGLSAPGVLDIDVPRGLALLEDLGDDLFSVVIERGGDETALYTAAAQVLARVHTTPPPFSLPYPGGEWPILSYDELALAGGFDLFCEWMPRRFDDIRIGDAQRIRWERIRSDLFALADEFPRALILRDTHAENLIWLPDREGPARVGLLDFQDAVLGWGEWDLSMLLHDARRDVSPEAAEAAIRSYLDLTGGERAALDHRLAVLGAINIMRIQGVFARLVTRDQKPRYDAFQPRLARLLGGVAKAPALDDLASFLRAIAPRAIAG
ncbi:phosphotransferase [bacterium]|nr:phosphotransferase [bacterium]